MAIQFYGKVRMLGTVRQGSSFDADGKLASSFFVINVEGMRHRFGCTELQLPFLKVGLQGCGCHVLT